MYNLHNEVLGSCSFWNISNKVIQIRSQLFFVILRIDFYVVWLLWDDLYSFLVMRLTSLVISNFDIDIKWWSVFSWYPSCLKCSWWSYLIKWCFYQVVLGADFCMFHELWYAIKRAELLWLSWVDIRAYMVATLLHQSIDLLCKLGVYLKIYVA